jgi:hypothetical protein
MTRSSSTMTCLRCGNKDLAISQYECPQCGKPNLKAVTTGTMIGGSWLALCFIGLFGLIAAATVWSKVEALLK